MSVRDGQPDGRVGGKALGESDALDLDEVDAIRARYGSVSAGAETWGKLDENRRRRDLEWAGEIVEHCDLIGRYVAEGRGVFDDPEDPRSRDAIEMRFIKIRHVVKALSPQFREECGIKDLDALVGMTDRIAHNYLRLDYDIMRNAARDRLPQIREGFRRAVEDETP